MSYYYPETFENSEKEKHYMIPISEYNRQSTRIAELEAQVEALTPKPVVVSVWANIYDHKLVSGGWHKTRKDALGLCDTSRIYAGTIRRDTITHPDGRVEYKLEVET